MQQVTDDVVRRQAGSDTIYTIALSPDGSRLASGSWDNDVALWDVASGRELARFDGGVGRLYSVAFSPDGSRVATASADRTARVWILDRHRLREQLWRMLHYCLPTTERVTLFGEDRDSAEAGVDGCRERLRRARRP